MSCGTELAATQWEPSYKRATWVQAPLAAIGFLCSVVAWLAASNKWWLFGGSVLGLVVPFTFLVIMQVSTTDDIYVHLEDGVSDEAVEILAGAILTGGYLE